MKNRAFVLGGTLCLINVALNLWICASGLVVLGVLLCLGTILVFASGSIWLIYQGDGKLHFRRGWVIIPLGIFGAALVRVFQKSPVIFSRTQEDVNQVGSLVLARYQAGVWYISLILLFVFVMAGSLLLRRRA